MNIVTRLLLVVYFKNSQNFVSHRNFFWFSIITILLKDECIMKIGGLKSEDSAISKNIIKKKKTILVPM